MSAQLAALAPASATPREPPARQAVDYRAIVDDLIVLGAELARHIQQRALATPATSIPATSIHDDAVASAAFERVARCVRRTILLARKLAEPVDPAPQTPAAHRAGARRRIIRAVEDAIQRPGIGGGDHDGDDTGHQTHTQRDALHAEFLDRLDRPEFDDDIDHLPIADIIADICRDLGLVTLPGVHPWKRRTPDDVAELCARAAKPPNHGAPPQSGAATDRPPPGRGLSPPAPNTA